MKAKHRTHNKNGCAGDFYSNSRNFLNKKVDLNPQNRDSLEILSQNTVFVEKWRLNV